MLFRSYLWSCLKQLQCYKEEDRSNMDAQSDWSCPACHDLSLDDKEARSHASHHELLKVTWSPTWEPKELLHSWASFRQMIQIHETKQIAPVPPLDEGLDNLERQGFCTSINHSRWKSTQGKEIRSKACFDMQPTNPHVDITSTGHYEVWIRAVDLFKDDIAQNRSPMINATHKASLPKLYEARAACIYKPDGKCIGMMTPERFHLLR